MQKISLILSTAALTLQNSGARAATQDLGAWADTPFFAPHPATVALVALIAMGILVLMTSVPISTASLSRWKWPRLPNFWVSPRATLALLAMIAVSGSLGIA